MLRFKNYVGFIKSVLIVNSLMLVLIKNQITRVSNSTFYSSPMYLISIFVWEIHVLNYNLLILQNIIFECFQRFGIFGTPDLYIVLL